MPDYSPLTPFYAAMIRSCHNVRAEAAIADPISMAVTSSYDADSFVEFARIHTAAGTPCAFCGRAATVGHPVQPIHIVTPRLGGNEEHHNLLASCYRCYLKALAITDRLYEEWVARGGYAGGMPEENPMILEALQRGSGALDKNPRP